ncbi:Uncharacterised protein [Collinsella intestinalis]|nr:Uncharacterised protein [Collinsella intestinalis]
MESPVSVDQAVVNAPGIDSARRCTELRRTGKTGLHLSNDRLDIPYELSSVLDKAVRESVDLSDVQAVTRIICADHHATAGGAQINRRRANAGRGVASTCRPR